VERESDVTEFLPDAYLLTDPFGVVRKANHAAAALFDKPQWQLVGKPITAYVPLDDRPAFRRGLNQFRGQVHRVDDWVVRFTPSGSEPFTGVCTVGALHDREGRVSALRWLVRLAPLTDGVGREPGGEGMVNVRAPAITADPNRRRADLLVQAGALLASSFDAERTLASVARLAMPLLGDWCTVDLLDGDPHNPRLRRVLAASVRQPRGDTEPGLRDLLPAATTSDHPTAVAIATGEPQFAAYGTGGFVTEDDDDARRAGALFGPLQPASCIAVPLVARGQTLGALTFLMVESGRRHSAADFALAQELAHRAASAAENARLYRLAQAANEVKSRFLAAISHDLRTPLTAVMGYTELLADEVVGPLSEAQKRHLGRIRASSEHVLSLVEEILAFSRIEAGQERLALRTADAVAIGQQVVAVVEPLARRKGIALCWTPPQHPVPIRTDPAKARQVLINLLGNAVKYTDRGEVGLSLRTEDGQVYFETWDTGIGIPADLLPRVFDPFWQVEPSGAGGRGGVGLGLHLAQRLSQLLGGSVSVRSTPGVGSRFTFRHPVDATPAPDGAAPSDAAPAGRPAAGPRRRRPGSSSPASPSPAGAARRPSPPHDHSGPP
jgi:signal transduction histidine kinase